MQRCKHCGSNSIKTVKITSYEMVKDCKGIAQVKFTLPRGTRTICTKCTSTAIVEENTDISQ